MAVIFIVYFSTVLAGVISLAKKSDFIKELVNISKTLLESIELLRHSAEQEIVMKQPVFTFNFFMEIELLKFSFWTFGTIFIGMMLNKVLNLKRIYLMMVMMFLQVIVSSVFFKDTIPLLIIIGILLSIMLYFVPLGSGKYFGFIEYCSFLTDIYSFKHKELTSKKVGKFIARIILPIFPFLVFMKMLIPSMSIYILSITYVAANLLIFLNSNENKVQFNLKKIVIYSLIIIVTISSQKNFDGSVLEIVVSILAIFFSLDRVLAAVKELRYEIEDNSILYLLEKKSEDIDWLLENKQTFEFESDRVPSELFLLKQIIICLHLNEKDQLLKLVNLYNATYEINKRFVLQIKYFFTFTHDESDYEERYEYLKEVFELDKSRIEFFPAVIEYGFLLFLKNENCKMITDLMAENWYALDDESKYILYYAYKQQNENKSAEILKNEISNFDVISEEFNAIFSQNQNS